MSGHEPHRCASCGRILKIGKRISVSYTPSGGKTQHHSQFYCPSMRPTMDGVQASCVTSWTFE